MSTKYLTLEFVFEEEIDEGYVSLRASGVSRETNLTDDQIDALGEEIAWSDRWQVDNWNIIQRVMGNSAWFADELV